MLPTLALALAAIAGCSTPGTNTQVLVIVDAEPTVRSRTQSLQLDVRSGPGGSQLGDLTPRESRTGDPFGPTEWPRSVVLVPTDRDADRVYEIEVTAVDGSGAPVATVRAFSGYVAGTTRVLRLFLRDDCIGIPCDLDTTCSAGTCVMLQYTDPGTLPLRDVDAGAMDAGTTVDVGTDAADTSVRLDAADAGVPDDAWVCDPSLCDDGVACTDDTCAPSGCVHTPRHTLCDDHEICTDDTCDPSATASAGCTHAPNTVGCDDGVFCDGLDTCGGGTCSVHAGSPCGSLTCVEAADTCSGCDGTHPCPGPTTGSWSSCSYVDPTCSTEGTHSRLVVTFACNAGTSQCEPTNGSESEPCGTRTTQGMTCGTPSCDPAGTCTYSSTCDESGIAPRTCHDFTCQAGVCTDMPSSSPLPCGRTTDGDPCDDGIGCTGPDHCATEVCSGPPICDMGVANDAGMDGGLVCDDGFDCTLDVVGSSCTYVPNDLYCNYGGACSTGTCNPTASGHDVAGCVYTYACPDAGGMRDAGRARCEGGTFVCDDLDPCTSDTCMPLSPFADGNGCVFTPVTPCGAGSDAGLPDAP